ncbi:MAG: ankyrin repeat domain-containing protein [Candidatus Babeliales bacterium]
MKIIGKLILGLLLTPGLYAMDKQFDKEQETKRARSAQQNERIDTVNAARSQLIKQSPEQTEQADKLRRAMVDDKDIEKVQELLVAKADVNARTSYGGTAIRYAFDPAILKLLLDSKANINSFDFDKRTILHLYCSLVDQEKISIPSFRLLLDHGADVNAQDGCGDTPLHRLMESRPKTSPKDFVLLLLERGADCAIRNFPGPSSHGQTCLDALYDRSLRNLEHSSDDKRACACMMLLAFDEHRKRIKQALVAHRSDAFTRGVDDLVVAYIHGPRLDELFTEFKWLFDQLRQQGKLS